MMLRKAILSIVLFCVSEASYSSYRPLDSFMLDIQEKLDQNYALVRVNIQKALAVTPQYQSLNKKKNEINFKAKRLTDKYIYSLENDYKDLLAKLIGINSIYRKEVDSIILSMNLPKALGILPLLISGYNPHYNNQKTGGSGYWQLSYPMAVRYGVHIDHEVDYRSDVIASTLAACRAIKELHRVYKDWNYAVLAFLQGAAVTNTFVDSSTSLCFPEDYLHFQSMWAAVDRVLNSYNPSSLEYLANTLVVRPRNTLETYKAERKIQISDLKGYIDIEALRYWNTALSVSYIPKGYSLKLTHKDKLFIIKGLDKILAKKEQVLRQKRLAKQKRAVEIKKQQLANMETYMVKSGDILGLIARKTNTSVSKLMALNKLSSDRIYVGQKLKVKRNVKIKQPLPNKKQRGFKVVETNQRKLEDKEYKTYVIKSGDSLWKISQDFPGVSAEDIMKWNRVSEKIYPGQKIKIYLKEVSREEKT